METYQKYIIKELVGNYEDGVIGRREALLKLAAITGSAAVAASLLAGARPVHAQEETPPPPAVPEGVRVPEDDPEVEAGWVVFPGPVSDIWGYLAAPADGGSYPGVIIIHENAGMTPHFEDVARRTAKAGFVGLAVDLLSRVGSTDAIPQMERPAYLTGGPETAIPPADLVQDLWAAVDYLETHPRVRPGGVGAFGFCFGGGMTWRLVTTDSRVAAAVPFYGPNPPLEDIPNMAGAVMAIYGVEDRFINPMIPALTEALVQSGKPFQMLMYPNANHAFFNDMGARYNPDAAADAWDRTIDFLRRHL